MGVSTIVYNTVFRRTSTFFGAVVLSAFAFEIGFNAGIERLWDSLNKGRQWKDIREKYVKDE
ncbi:hypothetical protein HK096_006335 [Nowakowskiella sp. JEL0078]|nr:hypothetical protein HK096_006335 [Nowakowskiella sp. JEL0078]